MARVIPPFGFEPDGAYLAGLSPEESDGGAHFWYSPETSPFHFLEGRGRVLDKLPWRIQRPLRLTMRAWIQSRAKTERLRHESSLAAVPFEFLPYFDYREQVALDKMRFKNAKTLFELASEAGLGTFSHIHPIHDVSSIAVTRRVLRESSGDSGFIFLFIGDLDRVGHRFGPDSPQMAEAMRTFDKCIERIHNHLRAIYRELDFVLLGDHGMVPVRRRVDIIAALRSAGVKFGVDVIPFIDSTLARFWCKPKHKEALEEALDGIAGGRRITAASAAEYKIRWPHRKHGDVLYMADGGTIFSPNYWQGRQSIAGMHGYGPEVTENHAAVVWHTTALENQLTLPPILQMQSLYPLLAQRLQWCME